MRNRLNIIQINGVKGLIFVACAICCLVAGFVAFPGLILKCAWNFISALTGNIPAIGIIQGVLLWGIIVVSFFLLGGRRSLFVEFKSSADLSQEELNAVMNRIRSEKQSDTIAKSIIRARELELKARKELHEKLKKDMQNTIEQHIENHVERKQSEIR